MLRSTKSLLFRHTYGENVKREFCFDGIRVTKMATFQGNICAVNPKFLAVIVECSGGGAFLVIPLINPGKLPTDAPLVNGHKGPVLDIAWCPHDDHLIASASEDFTAMVWRIPEHGLTTNLSSPEKDLQFHTRPVNLVRWHPSADQVLLTASKDCQIGIWDAKQATILIVIKGHVDLICCVNFNWDGSRVLTTSRDGKIRIFDCRTGDLKHVGALHDAAKPTQAVFLRNGLIFTTGFSKSSHRQFAMRASESLEDPIRLVDWDGSNSLLNIWYDPDTELIYLCGKGDARISYFEIMSKSPYLEHLGDFPMIESIRGVGMMPRRGCNVSKKEIGKFYSVSYRGFCQVVSFLVPRKFLGFYEDLYPETLAPTPALSSEEWFKGANADPSMICLHESERAEEEASYKRQNLLAAKSKIEIFVSANADRSMIRLCESGQDSGVAEVGNALRAEEQLLGAVEMNLTEPSSYRRQKFLAAKSRFETYDSGRSQADSRRLSSGREDNNAYDDSKEPGDIALPCPAEEVHEEAECKTSEEN